MPKQISHLVLAVVRAHQPLPPREIRDWLKRVYNVEISQVAAQSICIRMCRENQIARIKGAKYCTHEYAQIHDAKTEYRNRNNRAIEIYNSLPWEEFIERMIKLEKKVADLEGRLGVVSSLGADSLTQDVDPFS